MDNIDEKLNKTYSVKLSGAALLVIMRLLDNQFATLEETVENATERGEEPPHFAPSIMAVIHGAHYNLIEKAWAVFGQGYVDSFMFGPPENLN